MKLSFELNGQPTTIDTPADRRVVDLLREDLGLTGTKESCGTGECGACTVLIDGDSDDGSDEGSDGGSGTTSRLSCLMLAAQLAGRRVTTVEGLAATADGARVQQAFVEHGAIQCGYCIPGMELAATALLRENATPTRAAIREGLSGNLCRCTGYVKIVDAVEHAAHDIAQERE